MTTGLSRRPYWAASLLLVLLVLPALSQAVSVERGPYLQLATEDSITIRWRTDTATDSVARYGLTPDALNESVSSTNSTRDHEVRLEALQPGTRYFYSIGDSGQSMAGGDESHSFVTSPPIGTAPPIRVWILGDSGTADNNARAVRDAYYAFTGNRGTDLWLMLGDNAYNSGTDAEYQAAVFDMYPQTLRQAPLWSTLGNHDGYSSDSGTQTGPYYDIFSLPRNAQAGGLPSGTEAYYSFDYGNVHFVCLDSYDANRSPNGAMLTWLANDLAATAQDWVIAFWHHPPYSKGSHDSDTEGALIDMRQYALPILESYGVDLVLTGHSHSYERSYLLDGHYGDSGELAQYPDLIVDAGDGREDGDGAYDKSGGPGAVYAVAGSSGKISGGPLDHPAMVVSLNTLGSMVLDIEGNRLDAVFLTSQGDVSDRFTLVKGPDVVPPTLVGAAPQGVDSVLVELSEPLDAATAQSAANYLIDNGVTISAATLQADGRSLLLATSPLTKDITYTLTAANVQDLAGNPMEPGADAQFVWRDLYTLGFQDSVSPTADYSGTRDTYIHEGQNSDNYGTAGALLLDGDDGGGDDVSVLIAWDLSALPPEATVESASIVIEVFDPSASSYGVYRLKRPWRELEATWRESESGQPWGADGALGIDDRGAALLGAVASPSLGSYEVVLNADGVALVQGWVDGSVPNHGVVIADSASSDGVDLDSREAAIPSNRPSLSITYSIGPDLMPPTAPTDLQVVGKTASTISLAWTASEDDRGISGYDVYRDGNLVGSPRSTSFTDTGLDPSTAYSYAVIAIDISGKQSVASEGVAAQTDVGCAVSGADALDLSDNKVDWTLTNTGPESVTIDHIDVIWPAAQGDLKRIKVGRDEIFAEVLPPPSASIESDWDSDTGRRVLDVGDSEDLRIEFTERYKNDVEDDYSITVRFAEGCSVSWSATPDTEPPTTPANLRQTAATTSTIALFWNASGDDVGVTGYEIRRDGSVLGIFPDNDFTDTGLAAKTAYGYEVVALDQAGNRSSPASLTAATAGPDIEPPTLPTNLQVAGVGPGSVELVWNAATDNQTVAGYRVYRDGQLTDEIPSTAFTDTELAPETTYAYAVTAIDTVGNESSPSGSVTVTTGAAPTCTVQGAAEFRFGRNKVEWDLTNPGTETVTIDRIDILWPAEQGNLKRIKLDRDEIYGQSQPPPTATIDSGWDDDVSGREIDGDDKRRLKLEFTDRYNDATEDDYAITVHFAEGCAVQIPFPG